MRGVTPMLQPPTLTGSLVRLEPLSTDHVEALAAAAGERSFGYDYTAVPAGLEATAGYVTGLLAAGGRGETVPFAQIRRYDDRAVGVTRFLTLRYDGSRPTPYAVEIGGTWLGASAQRTGLNREAKRLLLTHAFDAWQVGRVDLKTDERNAQSRAGIAGLGARFEGILRSWQPSQVAGEAGLLRNTAMYSITAEEWPGVRERLAARRSHAR